MDCGHGHGTERPKRLQSGLADAMTNDQNDPMGEEEEEDTQSNTSDASAADNEVQAPRVHNPAPHA